MLYPTQVSLRHVTLRLTLRLTLRERPWTSMDSTGRNPWSEPIPWFSMNAQRRCGGGGRESNPPDEDRSSQPL